MNLITVVVQINLHNYLQYAYMHVYNIVGLFDFSNLIRTITSVSEK